MKFHFSRKKLQKAQPARAISPRKRCSVEQIRTLKKSTEKERIDLFGTFEEPPKKKGKSFLKKAFLALTLPIRNALRKKKHKPRRPPANTSRIFGAVCVAFAITLCAGITTLSFLFGRYSGDYDEVVIPSLLSLTSEQALATESELFEYSIFYSSDPERKANEVISQSPAPNVVRKLYSKKQRIHVSLTVNKQKEDFILPNIIGMRTRDALLILKNAGIPAVLIEEYSDTVARGTVVNCSHRKGSALKTSDRVILTSSKGAKTRYVQMPDLIGLCESDATERLNALGFKTESVSYIASPHTAGIVIAQSHKAGESLKEGAAVSFTVSAGKYFENDD